MSAAETVAFRQLLAACKALYAIADPTQAETEEVFLAICEQARAAIRAAEEVAS